MRMPLIAGNWKMNGNADGVEKFAAEFKISRDIIEKRQMAICPPLTLLSAWKAAAENKPHIKLGAQNAHWQPNGAYTGEVSPGMLKEAGCWCCIVGHSERRQYFGENDADVNKKMNALLDAGLVPIVCVGETLEERESGKMEQVITTQVSGSVLASADRGDLSVIVVAYEPVWAIGTGKTATSDQAQEVCGLIRKLLSDKLGTAAAAAIRILYGGSVKPDNMSELMSKPDIDGGLVGGASLKASDFMGIVGYEE